ncbi:MAG: ABC transporter permease, partial [Leadbetterella sp.]|nr:ABC transporter permease [Leadbetterella sp.]
IFGEKESYNGGVAAPLYQGIRAEVPGIQRAVPVFGQWVLSSQTERPGGTRFLLEEPASVVAVDSSYFNMIPYRWLAGSRSAALSSPDAVVLTESRMAEYFPGIKPEEALGRRITATGYQDTTVRVVTGVVKDLPQNTEFIGKEFYALPEKVYPLVEWTNTNGSDKLYLQLPENGNAEQAEKQLQALAERKWKEFAQSRDVPFKTSRWFEIIPLSESHFTSYIPEINLRKASKPVMFGLMGVAVFLLILACINYVNMSIAQMPHRSREIGVRKTLGGGQWALIRQFLTETLLTTLLAVVFSVFLVKLGFGVLKDIIPQEIKPFNDPGGMLILVSGLTLAVTLLAGIYPAWLVTRVKTSQVFKANVPMSSTHRRFGLQKVLIVFQFIISLTFITSALIGGRQLKYTLNKDMGFNKDAVVLVSVPWKYLRNEAYKGKQLSLHHELRKHPGIKDIALGTEPLSSGYSSSPYTWIKEGQEPVVRQLYKKWIDTSYVGLYDLQLLAGRNLSPSDTTNELIINESAVTAFGFSTPQDAIGKTLKQSDGPVPVVGVVADFNMQSFYNKIEPAVLMSNVSNLSTLNIRLDEARSDQWPAVIQDIEKEWNRFYPKGSFRYSFYDETIAQLYAQERNLATLINLATAIAVLISCIGLFGLATLTAYQRTKEIGIRKVLGSSVAGIVTLLTKEYVGLVSIAFLIASPVAWWVMHRWLEGFVYRTDVSLWIFALSGISALAIALLTVGYQAVKAAMTNPVKSLRTE